MATSDDVVSRIVEQLERNPLNDPRRLKARQAPLATYMRGEVQRSIKRLPLALGTEVTAAQARQLAKLLHNHDPGRALMYARHSIRGLPDGGDPLKLRCAEEAYFLMEMFSEEQPSGTESGPYLMIASLLYEAHTGKREGDDGAAMKRPCTRWLKHRQKYPNNNPNPKGTVS